MTTRAKGTGLGLAIVRKIMEDHGGEIVLGDARKTAKGAEVTLTFPLQAKELRVRKEVRMSKNGSPIASEILVVDDEEDIRDLIAGILRDEGYETRVAGDSDGALAAVRAAPAAAGRARHLAAGLAGSTASRCWTRSSASSPICRW